MKVNLLKTKYNLIALLGIMLVTVSCSDDFFEQNAGNRILPENHYKSMIDVDVSAIGLIAALQEVMPNMIIVDGLRSDLMDVTSNADVDMNNILNNNFTTDNKYISPSGFYKIIINANEILANIDKVPAEDPNFDEYYTFAYKSAIVGLRTWAYFNIIKIWGEAAYIPDNIPAIKDNMSLQYVSKNDMLDTLINQLTPFLHVDEDLAEERIEYYVNNKALLGEIYLEKNDYGNAATYLKMGLESYGNASTMLKVDKTYTKESWKNIFINSENNTTEVLGVVPFSNTENQRNPLAEMMLYNDKYMVKPTQKIIEKFASQKLLKGEGGDIYRGIKVTYDTIPGGNVYISKYSLDIAEPYSSDIIFSRAADLHLLLAEAFNRSGECNTALILLNAGMNAAGTKKPKGYTRWTNNLGIRGRAYLKNIEFPKGISSQADSILFIEDQIIEERSMEMAYEGKRFTDLVRIAKRRGDASYLANRVAEKFTDQGKADAIRSKLMNEANWYLPFDK